MTPENQKPIHSTTADRPIWWGSEPVELGETILWRVASLRLWAHRAQGEWRIAYEWEGDPDGQEDLCERGRGVHFPEEGPSVERHAVGETGAGLTLQPALADRPVVTRPRLPLYVRPGAEVTLYVGSPLWLRIETESPSGLLREIPVWRPSDTWFGASTRAGELCYATRTRAVLDPASLPSSVRRALTPVRVRNLAGEQLAIERFRLPVPFLSLFSSRNGDLWTETVSVDHEETALASVHIDGKAPPIAGRATRLTPARQKAEKGLLMSVFEGLFGR